MATFKAQAYHAGYHDRLNGVSGNHAETKYPLDVQCRAWLAGWEEANRLSPESAKAINAVLTAAKKRFA